MNDETLVKKCLKDDANAQRLLFENYAPKMMSTVLRYMKNKEISNDVVQDGFIKVFKNLNSYKKEGTLEGWIKRIMINTALDELRKERKYNNSTQFEDLEFSIALKEKTDDKLLADNLLDLVQQLPDGYRTIFNLYAIEGYSHKEIGILLEITESTSKSQYSRARKVLQEALKNVGIER
jgi:RNA polymerase sigma-70 factor (ECF subfamily)